MGGGGGPRRGEAHEALHQGSPGPAEERLHSVSGGGAYGPEDPLVEGREGLRQEPDHRPEKAKQGNPKATTLKR